MGIVMMKCMGTFHKRCHFLFYLNMRSVLVHSKINNAADLADTHLASSSLHSLDVRALHVLSFNVHLSAISRYVSYCIIPTTLWSFFGRSEGPTPRMPPMPRPLTPIDPVSRRTSPSQTGSGATGPPAPQQRLSPHSGPRSARASPTVRRPSPVHQPSRREPPPPPPTAPGSMPSIFGMLDEAASLPMPTPPAPAAVAPAHTAHAPPRKPVRMGSGCRWL